VVVLVLQTRDSGFVLIFEFSHFKFHTIGTCIDIKDPHIKSTTQATKGQQGKQATAVPSRMSGD